jgi:hypothetical protein
MAITLAEITRVTLRQSFLPWFRREMAAMDIPLPTDWNPDDEELARLAEKVSAAFREDVD